MAKQSAENQDLSNNIRAIFEDSFTVALPKLQILERMQAAYECKTPESWGTYSQIFLPHFRTAVEQALPNVFNYLLPRGGLVDLEPRNGMSFAQVQDAEDYFDDLVRKKINLKKNGLLTLKDCMKLNVGYGDIGTEIITPIDALSNTIFQAGQRPIEVRRMDLGAPKEVIRYNYVDWRQIVPTPDGATPEEASGTFHLDDMREDEFLAMYRADAASENPVLMGDPNDIIAAVRDGKSSLSHFPIWTVMGQFGTTDNNMKRMRRLNQTSYRLIKPSNAPIRIPIMKSYFKREHVWIVPDGTIIYHIKDSVQTMRNPIVKATANPDGNEWFPVGDAGSSFDATEGSNIFQNALMDMVSYHLNPASVVNRALIQDENVVLEPHAQFNAYGRVGDAVAMIPGPQIQPGMLTIGSALDQTVATANGQPQNLQGAGVAGVMRGGGGAFESFLQTTQARSKLAGAVLQTGWLEDVVNQVILLAQIVGQEDSYVLKDELAKSYVEKTITTNELRHGFVATVSLDGKFNQTPSERAMDMAMYRDVYKDNVNIDQDAALAETIGDQDAYRRVRATEEVKQKNIEEQQARAEADAKAKQLEKAPPAGGGGQPPQGGGVNPGMQAVQGGGVVQ